MKPFKQLINSAGHGKQVVTVYGDEKNPDGRFRTGWTEQSEVVWDEREKGEPPSALIQEYTSAEASRVRDEEEAKASAKIAKAQARARLAEVDKATSLNELKALLKDVVLLLGD